MTAWDRVYWMELPHMYAAWLPAERLSPHLNCLPCRWSSPYSRSLIRVRPAPGSSIMILSRIRRSKAPKRSQLLPTVQTPALSDSQKIRIRKSRAGEAVPTYGLLSKMVESGLLVQHPNNRMRFLHPVLNGYLSGQAIGDNDADATLLAQPDWDGRNLSLHYLAARGDADAVADILLKEFRYSPPHHGLPRGTLVERCSQRGPMEGKGLQCIIEHPSGRGPAQRLACAGHGSFCCQQGSRRCSPLPSTAWLPVF